MEIKPLTAQIDVVIDNEPLNTKIIELQNQIKELENEKSELQIQLETAQEEITELENQIKNLDAQILELQNELQNLQDDLDNLNGEVAVDKSKYALETKNLIANAIKNKGGTITPSTTFRSYTSAIDALELKKTGDPHTLLLMHFDKSPTQDSSIYDCKFIVKGTPTITTEKSKFGTGSLYLDGASCSTFDRLYFYPFTPQFTLEFWWYPPDDFSTSSRFCLFSQNGNFPDYNNKSSERFNHAEFLHGKYYQEYFISETKNTDYTYPIMNSSGLKMGQWNHFAIVRDYNNYPTNHQVYINGIQNPRWASTMVNPKYHSMSGWDQYPIPLTLFAFKWANGTFGRYFKGWINDLRISNVARYTANFTPPTEPFSV